MSRAIDLCAPSEPALEALAASPRPLGMRPVRTYYQLLRETYYDTRDGALEARGTRLCLRLEATGRRTLEVASVRSVTLQGVTDTERLSAPVVEGGLYASLQGDSEAATRVREVVDPAALRPLVALDVDRETKELKSAWFGRPTLAVHFDRVLAHREGATRSLFSVKLVDLSAEGSLLERLTQRLQEGHVLRADGRDTLRRALDAFVGDEPIRPVGGDARMAVFLRREGAVGLMAGPHGFTLPARHGSGEDQAVVLTCELAPELESVPEPELVGFTPSRAAAAELEVWLVDLPPGSGSPAVDLWIPLPELLERVGAPRLRDPYLVAALLLLARAEVGQRLLREGAPRRGGPQIVPVGRRAPVPPLAHPEDLLEAELSILDFHQRVLEMAEDTSLPLLERFRFLSIFASNMDEFFVVRVGRLKARAGKEPEEAEGEAAPEQGESPARMLDLISIRVRALAARHYACLQHDLLPRLAERGVRLRRWAELDAGAREGLARRFETEIFPLLTPRAMAGSPGHPFPRLESLGLSLAAVLRGEDEGIVHLAHVPVHASLPRFIPLPGGADLVPVEEIIAAHAASLFPAFKVAEVHAFRVSRMEDVDIDEGTSASLLAAVEDEVEARPYKPVVRLEVQRTMPREVLAYLLRELRQEAGAESSALGRGDVFEVDGPLDLRSFAQMADLALPGGSFAPFTPREAVPPDRSIFDTLKERDVLVYHPYESFDGSVARLISEASRDPEVVAIRLTLYRTGKNSAFADTLLEALRNGKEVSVFVELKARFDEESNIQWTRRLIEAGGHVVYGVVGYKTHAKTALVVRREGDGVRRYVHVGTGNYNATTSRFYTDLGLLSSDPDLGADLNDFFNELTGSSGPPVKAYRRLLVAPNSLPQALQRLIEREAAHARAGRRARIQAKLNGLTDRRTVQALYLAAQQGVDIDLVVRAVCTLRPGVPGLSERIRVRSILGRFLEHARIFYFENAGEGEYFIASADWRRRNLRKRVEVAVPVDDPAARLRLRAILDAELEDPRAWVLRPDGAYERAAGQGRSTQERALAGDL